MATFDDIAELLRSATLAGPATDEAIRSAEAELEVQFSPSYRRFLASFGAALCEGFEIAGLFQFNDTGGPPLWSHVVTSTRQIRRVLQGSLPGGYVAISDDGGDYNYYLDTAHPGSGGECPVVALGPGVDSVVIARDFFEFVARSFEGSITF